MNESDIFEDIMEWGRNKGQFTYEEVHGAFPPEYNKMKTRNLS